ncbi:endonuclease domain-containing protein [Hymenobacter weizhouensis]|uniref:endonuclease domain-containing protein n=1 Tax=Hymenobacter sp. YIM 151500-1 TaxID=2987689 RepID=UPI00222629FB|nr:endonuclease domain-containing protein [Hymenobacter sp. YIM 151500-1]UYZ61948.1 endonuclease domain-containing protein [Hymenobacter sp. YIM 151500-1]
MPDHPERVHNLLHKKQLRRELRSHTTAAEASLWTYLQRSQLSGRKFRRQHNIGPYIADFYCPAEKLVIELDGAGHYNVVGNARDIDRTCYLEAQGLRVLRFENKDFWSHPESVLAAIEAAFSPNESLGRPTDCQPPLAPPF